LGFKGLNTCNLGVCMLDIIWCDSQAQAAVDQMALDETDSDEEKRENSDDSSDEDLDSAPTIRQQPEPAIGQQQVENMDISSTDG